MVHFQAWGSKNTLGEFCLKTARLVLIFRHAVSSISLFSAVKSFYQIVLCCLYTLFKIQRKAKAVGKSLIDVY